MIVRSARIFAVLLVAASIHLCLGTWAARSYPEPTPVRRDPIPVVIDGYWHFAGWGCFPPRPLGNNHVEVHCLTSDVSDA